MLVSKKTWLLALLVCPLVMSDSSTSLRRDGRRVLEEDKQPVRSGGIAGPTQAAPPPAAATNPFQTSSLPQPAPLAGIPPSPPLQNNPPPSSAGLPPPQNVGSPATGGLRAADGQTLSPAAGQQQQQQPSTTRAPNNTPAQLPMTPTTTGPQQQSVAQQQAQPLPPSTPSMTRPTTITPTTTTITPPGASQNRAFGTGGGWPVSTVAPSPPPVAIDSNCNTITPTMALTNEPTCGLALPAFATGTTDFAWARQSDPQRAATMDMFCQTPCGQTYTGTLLARRRGCNTPTPRGRTSVVPGGPQTFPPYFPGLMLGCIVDPEDGQYCAVKLASPTDGDCEFYKSCCYGELAMSTDGNAPETAFYDMVDKRCPGSAAYRTMPCLYSQNAVKPAAPAAPAAPATPAAAGLQVGVTPAGATQGMVPAPSTTQEQAAPAGPLQANPLPLQAAPLPLAPAGPAGPMQTAAAAPMQAGAPSPLLGPAAITVPTQVAAAEMPLQAGAATERAPAMPAPGHGE